MNELLPIYQHPALTVLVDDSRSFLDSVAFRMNPQLAYRIFDEPRTALDWLRNEYQHLEPHTSEIIRVGYDEATDSLERRSASIDLEQVYRTVADRRRFGTPAVLVVDYAMPEMDGVEFCRAAREIPCGKIMLTGHANEKIAIDAFNDGLIDCFIRKNAPDAMERLEAAVIKLQKDFFLRRTSTLRDLLTRHTYAFLSDPAIETLVEQLCSQHRFVEHYLFPHPAGILFFDGKGRATLMVIATRNSLTTQRELAEDEAAPPELLAALRELRLVPFFSDTHGRYLGETGNDWLQYCLPPQVCEGRETYYWALFELPGHYLREPVYSYAEFLRDQAG